MFTGAVARACTLPAMASFAAVVTHSMAALPHTGEIWPTVISSGWRLWVSTMLASSGDSSASSTSSIGRTFRETPVRLTACSRAQVLPITMGRQRSLTSFSARALAMTSGPMPQGSPMVMATMGFSELGMASPES